MRRIYRSKTNKKIAGICGGLGEMFSQDPTVVRLAVVFIGVVTGILPMVVTYLIGWVIIPEGPSEKTN
jgi:phage shock protein PspC (stress-responsive transcriptional regulator)